jgi:hypothetical protein
MVVLVAMAVPAMADVCGSRFFGSVAFSACRVEMERQ